jgi:hypothetical protein
MDITSEVLDVIEALPGGMWQCGASERPRMVPCDALVDGMLSLVMIVV